ncbi:hypothetical protein AYI70_g9098 [Smittium culicis]|uniref:Uncharacterized protein n=1 Tax=Smittium culicis TaxID=133412 RepID=A0A1R1XCX8_9FUNG|nr:hypothetical protein AYI70_g9098 [Smittium culicis]
MSQYEESIIQELAPSWAQEILFRLSDSAIEFVNAIRILFSELSSHVTQLRLDNAFMNVKIPGNALQILSASSNPLFDPKELVEIWRQIRQFRRLLFQHEDSGAVRSRSFGHRGRGGNSRTGFSRHTRILLDYFYGLEKIRRYSPSFKSETSESASASKALQNGESVDCMQAFLSERLDEKHRSCKRIPSRTCFSIFKEISQFSMVKQKFSLSRSSIWAFLDPNSFHEGIATRKETLIVSLTKPKNSGNENQYTTDDVRNTKIQVKKLASSIGKAQAMSIALLPGRLMTRRLIELNNEALRKKIRTGTQQETGSCSAQGLRAVVEPPSEFFDSPTLKFRLFCIQSSRLSFKDAYTDGMVNIRKDIQQDRYEVWTARCGYVRSPGEPQTVEICQLETITKSSRNGRFQSPVE